MSRFRAAFTVIAIGSLALGCWSSPQPAAACAADTPEKTFEHASAFMATGDVGGMAACLTPESRKVTARQMLGGLAMMVGIASLGLEAPDGEGPTAEQRTEIEAIAERFKDVLVTHGLSDPVAEEMDEAAVEAQLDGVDHGTLISDLADLMKSLDPSDPGLQSFGLQSYDSGDLTDLVVDGDSARGTAGGQPMVFARVDGLWYLVPEEM